MLRSLRLLIVVVVVLGIMPSIADQDLAHAASSRLHYLFGSGSQVGGKRITLRVELTGPAPAGGANVTLSASSNAIPVPPRVHINTGESEREFSVVTGTVAKNTDVTISAAYRGVTRSRIVQLIELRISSLSVQRVIRNGGTGKVTVRINGPAPESGYLVRPASDPTGALAFNGEGYVIPAGKSSISAVVAAHSSQAINPRTGRLFDQYVWVSANELGVYMLVRSRIRDFGDQKGSMATATVVLVDGTSGDTLDESEETAGAGPTVTPSSAPEGTSDSTGTPQSTLTSIGAEHGGSPAPPLLDPVGTPVDGQVVFISAFEISA